MSHRFGSWCLSVVVGAIGLIALPSPARADAEEDEPASAATSIEVDADDALLDALADVWAGLAPDVAARFEAAIDAAGARGNTIGTAVVQGVLLDGPVAALDAGRGLDCAICPRLRARGMAIDDPDQRQFAESQLEARVPALIDWLTADNVVAHVADAPDDVAVAVFHVGHAWRTGRYDEALRRAEALRRRTDSATANFEAVRDALRDPTGRASPHFDANEYHRRIVVFPGRVRIEDFEPYLGFEVNELRAIRARNEGQFDRAIDVLLTSDGAWLAPYPSNAHGLLLRALLRRDHSQAELQAAWTRAESTITVDAAGAHWTLLGRTLNLPDTLRCRIWRRPSVDIPATTEALVAFTRGSRLYANVFAPLDETPVDYAEHLRTMCAPLSGKDDGGSAEGRRAARASFPAFARARPRARGLERARDVSEGIEVTVASIRATFVR